MAISAQHIVEFTRHSVSGPSHLCWTVLRGGLARLLPALFALWTRLPQLLHVVTSKVTILENESLYIGSEESGNGGEGNIQTSNEDECLVTCEVLYDPEGNREMDIIFIHGLHGSTVKTWRQGDWNYKYQEVQRISLRNNNSNTSSNQGVCPHCHLMKYQARKSFCNLSDVDRVCPPTPTRSYSVPNVVYRSPSNNLTCDVNILYEEENETSNDADDDILSFIVSEHRQECSNHENSNCKSIVNHADKKHDNNTIEPDDMKDELNTNINDSKNEIFDVEKSTLNIRNMISDNFMGHLNKNMGDYDSLIVNDCDISFIEECLAGSVHNMRAVCDGCSNNSQSDFVNNCQKCLGIERLLLDNISTTDSEMLSDNIDRPVYEDDRIRSTVKRKYDRVDEFEPRQNNDSAKYIKVRKISTENEQSSGDEYSDAENEFCDLIGLKGDFLNISNDELNDLTLHLSDDSDIHQNIIFPRDNTENEVECNIKQDIDIMTSCSNDPVFKRENNLRKQFCTCDNNNKCDTIKMENKENCNKESPSSCWPKDWLPLDYPNARIISLSYTTDQHLWRPIWIKPYSRTSLKDRSNKMVQKLAALDVGNKPIIWVGHSKGGLFIKEIFSSGYESSITHENPTEFELIYKNTKGLVFYSVPHRGSPLANITFPPLLRVSSELEEIQHESDFVLKLHERFLSALEKGDVDPAILSYSETRRTLMGAFYLRIVSTHSADPGVGHMYYGVSLDHREICKPTSRSCFLYKELLSVIDHIHKTIIMEEDC